jgi:hypothetical protein
VWAGFVGRSIGTLLKKQLGSGTIRAKASLMHTKSQGSKFASGIDSSLLRERLIDRSLPIRVRDLIIPPPPSALPLRPPIHNSQWSFARSNFPRPPPFIPPVYKNDGGRRKNRLCLLYRINLRIPLARSYRRLSFQPKNSLIRKLTALTRDGLDLQRPMKHGRKVERVRAMEGEKRKRLARKRGWRPG